MRILLVDDNSATRRAIRSLVSSHPDWELCGEAADGLEAIEKARQARPDAILMDVSMPRMNGLDATRIIRQALPSTKVIIVSTNDAAVVRQQAAACGAWAGITKDALARDLLPCIQKILSASAAAPLQEEGLTGYFPGPSEMASRMRAFNWGATEVGTPDRWPEALRGAVRICLTSRFPIVLWWGADYTMLYNDAYGSILGRTKHPQWLGRSGRECWYEIWPTIGPMFEGVFATGQATWSQDLLLVMDRDIPQEETYFTFSYSPILGEGREARVCGIFCACFETTQQVVSARRLETLRRLAAQGLEARAVAAACEGAAKVLEENPLDIPFGGIYLTSPDGATAALAAHFGFSAGDCPLPFSASISDGGGPWPIAQVLRTLSPAESGDLAQAGLRLPGGPWPEPASKALVLPVAAAQHGHLPGIAVLGVSPRRILDSSYRAFFALATSHIATAISDAKSYEEEQRRAEQLAELDRAKTAFFSNVSHEFRTPLTLMLGPLRDLLAQSKDPLSPAVQEQLELVSRNGERLLRLVNTLLDFSRIEAGRMRAVYQPTDLAHFTSGLASTFRSVIEKAGLRLAVDCREIGEPVYVDCDLWEKIVMNLLSNAFKFTFEGEIAVSLERAGREAELRVVDTGSGIPPEELPRLFERFHRVANARGRTFEGSGIGLALTEELVKLHGGSIQVKSAVGRGTAFTVRIPLGQDHLPQKQVDGSRAQAYSLGGAAAFAEEALRWIPDGIGNQDCMAASKELTPARPPDSRAVAPRARVLLADDNSDMRQYLARILEDEHDVEAVADGQAALEAVRARPPDLVLSDIMMPGLDGFELLKALRADKQLKAIPIILLSARAGEESRVEGIDAGADDYLVKPFSARELLARVRTHIDLARARREAEEALRALAESLEAQVRERTRDLEQRNAELLAQSDQVRELSARLLRAQDEERRRMARELHDTAGQTLTVLSIEESRIAQRVKRELPDLSQSVAELQEITVQLSREIRTASYLLHPPLLDESGLSGALRWYVEGLTARSGIQIDLQVAPDFGRLPAEVELSIFRVIQESLTNIHRHSASPDAAIRVARHEDHICVRVEDHGKGISPERLFEIQSQGGGVGIRGMRERLRQLRGEISIESSGAGTQIIARLPVFHAPLASEETPALRSPTVN